jgi:hypothetical protein
MTIVLIQSESDVLSYAWHIHPQKKGIIAVKLALKMGPPLSLTTSDAAKLKSEASAASLPPLLL